jgi:hypothetical protein
MDNVGKEQYRKKINFMSNPNWSQNAYRSSSVIPIIASDADQTVGGNLNSLRRINYNNGGKFNDLRGIELNTSDAFSRYAGDNVYDIISDTNGLVWESNFDPRNYMNCNVVNCPNSRDTRFSGDMCLNCRPMSQ